MKQFREHRFTTLVFILTLICCVSGCSGEMRPADGLDRGLSQSGSGSDDSAADSTNPVPVASPVPITVPGSAIPVATSPPAPPSYSTSTCVSRAGLTCVNTALPDQYFTQTQFKPQPADVLAFKFNTVASGSYAGSVSVARTSSSPASKLIVISSIPGDVEIANKPSGCYGYSYEVSTVRYVVNHPTVSPSIYCHLEPGRTYYFNLSSQTTSSTALTCSSQLTCGFSVSAR